MNIKSYIVSIAVSLVAFVILAAWLQGYSGGSFAGEGGMGAASCTMSATTTVVVGNGGSTVVIPAYAQNAYVRIQQPPNASNTVHLGFGVAATMNSSAQLATSTYPNKPDAMTLGLNTDFPFTGYVSAITDLGSTSLDVIICRY